MSVLVAIFVGGFLGAIARAGMGEWLPHDPGTWPWATFAVNVVGAFLLGYFTTRLQERLPLSSYRRPLLGTGFCGALTTFSTFSFETVRLLQQAHPRTAALNVLVSVVGALAACAAGFAVAVSLT